MAGNEPDSFVSNVVPSTRQVSCWIDAVLISNDLPELSTDLVAALA